MEKNPKSANDLAQLIERLAGVTYRSLSEQCNKDQLDAFLEDFGVLDRMGSEVFDLAEDLQIFELAESACEIARDLHRRYGVPLESSVESLIERIVKVKQKTFEDWCTADDDVPKENESPECKKSPNQKKIDEYLNPPDKDLKGQRSAELLKRTLEEQKTTTDIRVAAEIALSKLLQEDGIELEDQE